MLALVSPPDFAPEGNLSDDEIEAQTRKEFLENDPEVQEALGYWFDHGSATPESALILVERLVYLRERAHERAQETLEEEVNG